MLDDSPNEGEHPVRAVQAPIFTSNVPVPQKIELSGNLANQVEAVEAGLECLRISHASQCADRPISSGCIYHMYWSKSTHYSQWPSIPERSREEKFSENSRIMGILLPR